MLLVLSIYSFVVSASLLKKAFSTLRLHSILKISKFLFNVKSLIYLGFCFVYYMWHRHLNSLLICMTNYPSLSIEQSHSSPLFFPHKVLHIFTCFPKYLIFFVIIIIFSGGLIFLSWLHTECIKYFFSITTDIIKYFFYFNLWNYITLYYQNKSNWVWWLITNFFCWIWFGNISIYISAFLSS